MQTLQKNDLLVSVILVTLALLVNIGGRYVALYLNVPMWLDCLGTVFCSFYLGLVHGVVCAVLTNVIISFMVPDNDLFYVIVSISVSLVTVRFARHVDFKKFTSAVNYTGLLVLVSALLSFAINLFLYGGMSGSEWGDAVIIFLQEQGLSHICYPVGQLYIEFSDKIFVGYALYLHFRFFYHGPLIEMQKSEKEARNKKKKHYETEVLGEDTKLGDEERTSGRFSLFLNGLRKPHSMLIILCVFGLTVQPYSAHAASESMPRSVVNKENPSIDLRTLNGKALKSENSDIISANKQFSTFSVSADNPSFLSLQQTVFSSKNGLNCGTANDIATTKDGYLWVGTYAGLYQYDGQKFSQRDDLKNIRTVRSLYTDTSDRLWIGTGGLGVAVYEKGGVVATFDVNDSLASDYIFDMVDDGNGDYYIATTSGLSVFRYVNGKFVFYRNFIKGRSVISLFVLHDGMVAATSEHGSLYLFRGGEFIEEFRDDESTPRFYSIAEDMNGNIYLAGKDGIFLYHFYDQKLKKVGSFFNYELENINSIYWDKNGTEQVLFICADSGIFYLYNGKIRKLRTVGFDNSCERVVKDYQGNFWFTSSRLGLLELYRSQVENIFQGAGLEPTVVNCVIFWNNLLYVGTDSGIRIIDIVKRYDVETGFSNMLKGIRIRAFATDQHGNLVVCTYGKGAYIYDKNGRILRYQVSDGLFGNKVRTALTLNDDNLILAGNGITFIDKYGVLHTPLAESSLESFLCLTKFDENTVVGGTDGSGVVYIKDRKIEKRITKKDGLLSDVVLRVVKSKKYNLVYVLTGNGINTIDADYKVRSFEKFPYFNNYDLIQTAEGRLFITGSNGVYTCLEGDLLSDDKELDYLHFGNSYGISATLTSNSWNYLSENGMLYLCSSVGVFVLDTINYEVKSHPYKISIKELKLDDAVEPIIDGMPKLIARNVKKIQIMPEIVNFTREDPNICYYLAGFEDKKNYRRQSELFDISYTNVPPGTYSLNLEVLDANGMCIAKSSYPFTKASALWDTDLFLMYFYTIAFLMVAYVTWFFVRLFMQRTIDRQRHELELTEQLVRVGDETILTIAMALDARDKRTQLHSKRVSEYSVFIARELGFSEKECENLRKVALLHDIGKIGIPDRILNKPDRLTDEEFKIMRSHVTIGYEILKNFRSIAHVTDGIRYHHERYDGKGYVLGLKGEEIPIYGRIIAVADAFDAMASNRIYRQHLDIKEILLEIEKCKGKQFDPQCADIMIRLIRNGTIDLGKFYGEQYITGRPEGIVENAGNIYT